MNATLAETAATTGVAMGLGSQLAALRDHRLANMYEIARQRAPQAVLFANIGISQLLNQEREPALDAHELRDAIAMIRAQALVIT